MTRHGLYSATAAATQGTMVFGTPDGREVEITTVTDDPDADTWPDAVHRGEVTRFIRFGRSGTLTAHEYGDRTGPGARFPGLARLLHLNPKTGVDADLLVENAENSGKPPSSGM